MTTKKNKAVFLDKDGTLIENVPYNTDPAKIKFRPGTAPALQKLQLAGFRLIIVSNQPGVARGYFSIAAVDSVARYIREELAAAGVRLSAFYYCPHHPDGSVKEFAMDCACRKPGIGLFLRAGVEWQLTLNRCWMIGDILDDVEAGHRAGCRSILLDTGGEDQWVQGLFRKPDFITRHIGSAVDYILTND